MDEIEINGRWIRELLGMMTRPRPVCSCEVPNYCEDLFLVGEYRFRCGTCRGYIDLSWILEGHFPEPPKDYGDTDKK